MEQLTSCLNPITLSESSANPMPLCRRRGWKAQGISFVVFLSVSFIVAVLWVLFLFWGKGCLFLGGWAVACKILVNWPGIEPMPPAVEVWRLNHWKSLRVHSLRGIFSLLFFLPSTFWGFSNLGFRLIWASEDQEFHKAWEVSLSWREGIVESRLHKFIPLSNPCFSPKFLWALLSQVYSFKRNAKN